tara:strand:- start:4260 stop:4502 length:243 start_codon:yes stop_codon:yes gene_type:complete
MLWDILLTFAVACVIYVQHLTIRNQKRNLFILAEKIKRNSNKETLNYKHWHPKIIQGELDMVHQGKKATVKAIFYPKKVV